MKNILNGLLLSVGFLYIFLGSCAHAQMNYGMRNMEMQSYMQTKPHEGSPKIETVVAPDGHIIEYHHVNKGPVVEDSIPYLFETKLHWVPFAAEKCTRLIARHIESSPFKPGFGVGARADWYKEGRGSVYFSSGLNYAMMNLFYEGEITSPFSINTKLQAFYVPVIVGYQFVLNEKMKLGVGAGAQFGAFIRAESKEKEGYTYNPCGNFDATIGPELWFAYKNLQFGFQYDWGFQDLVYSDRQYSFVEYESSNRQTMTLSFGYRLWNE